MTENRFHRGPTRYHHLRHVHLRDGDRSDAHFQRVLDDTPALLRPLHPDVAARCCPSGPGPVFSVLLCRPGYTLHARQARLAQSQETQAQHCPHRTAAVG